MLINHEFTWEEYLDFQKSEIFSDKNQQIRIGNSKAFLDTDLSKLHIENDAKFIYAWNFFDYLFHETFTFNGTLHFSRKRVVNTLEKEAFLKYWTELKDIKYWGLLKGDSTKLTARNMGWALLDDIIDFVSKEQKNQYDELRFGSAYYQEYMSLTLSFSNDGPYLRIKIMNSGIYLMDFEKCERRDYKLSFMKDNCPKEEEEELQLEELKNLAEFIVDFLKVHTPRIDPSVGVIKIPKREE